MIYFQKKLPGFFVTYLHDIFNCKNCLITLDDQTFISKSADAGNHVNSIKRTRSKRNENSLQPVKDVYETTSKKISPKRKKALALNTSTDLTISENGSRCDTYKSSGYETFHQTVPESPKTLKKEKDDKIPNKGTLKRQRWIREKMENNNEEYEDDIFEDRKFYQFHLLESETDNSEQYKEMKTPVFPFSLSPRERTPSPCDSFSPAEHNLNRQTAENYNFQRNKRRKKCCKESKTVKKEKEPKSEESRAVYDVSQTINKVIKILEKKKKETEEIEEDCYFSDLSEDS